MLAVLIMVFYFQVTNIFEESLNKKLWEKSFFFCNKTKTETFWKITDRLFQILSKTLKKRNLRQTS